METVLIISGWAHGLEAIQPMGDALTDCFEVELRTGAQVLRERTIPAADYIITGSMGGLLALELLPASCKKLVLISSTARFCAGDDYPHGTLERVLQRMIHQLQRNPEVVLDEFFRNVHYPQRESRSSIRQRHDSMGNITQLARNPSGVCRSDPSSTLKDLIAGLEYLKQSDVRAQVPGIGIPVLLLHGAEDRIIPPGASKWLHDHLPVSCIKIFKNAGHALSAHQYATIMRQIRAFLQKPEIQ